ncbi:CRE-GNRR-8 protein [Caenorhabditis remanei]|uniref:CRE-GNRR-8 protein n=1 Tax=Caenorhabditis remanei TaxID=31234 RepID=E3NJH2_CAERE|nr:CRE-GNRR-8 protein [Caenorhabditis remanei]
MLLPPNLTTSTMMTSSSSESYDADNPILPPEPILGDYVEMFTLVLNFIVGAPLNLAAYTQLSERPTSTRLDLLKRSLNYSDLLVLFIYVPSRACWLLTYDWRGGDQSCAEFLLPSSFFLLPGIFSLPSSFFLLPFLKFYSFFLLPSSVEISSSNVIVCIAVDRLLSVLSPSHHSPNKALRRTKMMLIVAWIVALVISCPQLFVWRAYLALPQYNWSQCLQIWEIARMENFGKPQVVSSFDAEFWYSILHISLVFWIPCIIIMLSYIIVISWVWINSRPSIRHTSSFSFHTGCDTVDTVLTRASEWNPLKTFSRHVNIKEPEKPMTTPRIVVNDETEVPLTQRPSISPSEASAVMRTGVHTSTSYNANLNRSRAVRVSFLLVLAYIICWLPYNLISLIQFLDRDFFASYLKHVHFCQQLIIFNSVVNPYLYGFFGPHRPSHSGGVANRH